MSVRPLIKQAERLFATDIYYAQYCDGPGWVFDGTRGSITAMDFSQVISGPPCPADEVCPNFSVTGAPITFGMLTVNDHVDPGPGGVASMAVDNWRIGVWRR